MQKNNKPAPKPRTRSRCALPLALAVVEQAVMDWGVLSKMGLEPNEGVFLGGEPCSIAKLRKWFLDEDNVYINVCGLNGAELLKRLELRRDEMLSQTPADRHKNIRSVRRHTYG